MAAPAIHPGEHLAEELKALGMSAAELARQLEVPTNRVTGILNSMRAVTGDTALRLAHFFGTSPQFWLNLQALYELRLAARKAGKTIKALPTLKRPRKPGLREPAHAYGRATGQGMTPRRVVSVDGREGARRPQRSSSRVSLRLGTKVSTK
jgi:antitoxin HigA-1